MPPAIVITGPSTLPPGRTGLDYAPAAVQYSVTGGIPPYGWTLTAGAPAGLVIDQTSGKLSGIITAPCGTYSFNVQVQDSTSAGATLPVTLFISTLPNGLDLMKRLPNDSLKSCTVDFLNSVADAALVMISRWTGCPIRPGTCGVPAFTDEVIPTKTFTKRAMQRHHPITEITEALSNTTTLTVGSMKDVQLGNAQIAIGPDGNYLWLDSIPARDGFGQLFVSYKAGFDVLPDDLFEVFFYLAGLLFRERDRVGIKTLAVGESHTDFFRELPWPQQSIVDGYRRVLVYV